MFDTDFIFERTRRVIVLAILAVTVQAAWAQQVLLGVGMHVGGLTDQLLVAQLRRVEQTHLRSIRFDVSWKFVELVRGEYSMPSDIEHAVDEARAGGIEPVLILDYGNAFYDGGDKPRSREAIEAFGRFSAFVVKHFRGRVNQFEVWNEWDNHTGGFPAANAKDYAILFKAVYPLIRTANPEAKIIAGSGVHQGWEESLAELGVIQMSDGIAVHPYNYQHADGLAPEHCVQGLMQLEERLSASTGKHEVDLYVTEIGWPTNLGRFGASEEAVASYASRFTLLAGSLPYVKGVWWYDLKNDGTDSFEKEHNFGLYRADLTPKPAASTLAVAANFAGEHLLTMLSRKTLGSGYVVIEATPVTKGVRKLLIWDAAQTGKRVQLECDSVRGVRIREDTSAGGISVPGMPAVVSARDGQCEIRAIDSLSVGVK
ncbi:glycoside hydrolase family protein [Paraburkholderia terrae]|uniref:hypothetical protein n=1 Tax=Paraburkholderia terrae TaxID=311230 RepID=UPI00296AA494|nr:hypothetical protein [Paraburkholderia terrae]MDW3655379.1 hypothetical protein [Paraburkholderia terrae]